LAVYNLILYGDDDILREKAKPVKGINKNILKLLDNMSDTMYSNKGVGLAAPQIGVSKRVIVLDPGEGLVELINPKVQKASGREIDTEGCLSLPGLMGEVRRAARVVVSGLDRQGREVKIEASGYFARILQHEIDHLDGILFIDKAVKIRKMNESKV